jgi:quinol monooxygenase YgiN
MAALALCGAAWITVMTCAQMSAQTALPNWIRSRGIAVFLTFFMGSLGIGPVVWGSVAELTDLPTAMLLASAGLVVASLLTRRWPLSGNDSLDHTPSRHWRKPEPVLDIKPHQGPVMINVRYEVTPDRRSEFLDAIVDLGKVRKRDGARFWQYFEDAARPDSFVEVYVVDTWLDHLRQHERISRQDARVQERIKSLLMPGSSAVVSHFAHPLSTHETKHS